MVRFDEENETATLEKYLLPGILINEVSLLTGQNPASSEQVAKDLLQLLLKNDKSLQKNFKPDIHK